MTDLELAGDNRPPAYWELDGEIVPSRTPGAIMVIRASALGHCIWELAACLQDYTPLPYPDTILRAFKEGHDAEPLILERLLGPEMKWTRVEGAAQAVGELRVGPNRIIRFHPDDVAASSHEPTIPRLVEVKFLHPQTFEAIHKQGIMSPAATRYGYDWQLSSMMLGLRLPAVFVVGEKVRKATKAGAEPAPPTVGNLAMKYVETPPHSLGEIVRRVKEVYDVAVGDDLAESDRPCDRPDQWPCLFRHLRPEPEGGEENNLPDIPPDLYAEAERLLAGYVKFRALEAQAKKDKELLRDAVKGLLGDTAGKAGRLRYRLIPTTKKALNRAAVDEVLAEHEINLDDYVVEEPGTPRVDITEVKD